jgi:hypothetical protein
MKTTRLVIGVVAVFAIGVPVAAHHGAASFDTGKEVTLKGTVTDWIWSNPHCFLKFDVQDAAGTRSWMVETQNPTDMSRRGFARTSFKPGDAVTVIVEPLKNGLPVGRIKSVTLANGETLVAIAAGPAPEPQPGR